MCASNIIATTAIFPFILVPKTMAIARTPAPEITGSDKIRCEAASFKPVSFNHR